MNRMELQNNYFYRERFSYIMLCENAKIVFSLFKIFYIITTYLCLTLCLTEFPRKIYTEDTNGNFLQQ